MENKFFAYFIIIVSLVFLLGNCNGKKENGFIGKLDSTAVGDSLIYIDSTFTIEFEAEIGEVSGFGCHVVYDSTQITYLFSETFDHFDHELISLQNSKQGRLVIGFNQFDCENSVKNDTIIVFTATFHVKIDANEGLSPFYFENKEVKLCEADVVSEWYELDLWIREINRFVMRMRLR